MISHDWHLRYWDYPKYLTESEKISLILGQYGTDFLGLLAVSNRSRFLNFGLGPKEIRFSRALIKVMLSWSVYLITFFLGNHSTYCAIIFIHFIKDWIKNTGHRICNICQTMWVNYMNYYFCFHWFIYWQLLPSEITYAFWTNTCHTTQKVYYLTYKQLL